MTTPAFAQTKTRIGLHSPRRNSLTPLQLTAAVCLAIVSLSYASPVHAEPTQLRWNLKAGEAYRLALAQQIETTTTIGAKSTNISIEMALDMDWRVDAASDDSLTIAQTFSRARLKIAAPAQETIEYDSQAKEQLAVAARNIDATLRPLLGAEIVVTMSRQGEITDATLPAETAARLQQSAATPQLKQLFAPDQLNKLLRQAVFVLPAAPVDVGDTWPNKVEIPAPLGTIVQTTTFTLLGAVERDGRQLERIGVESQFEIADEKAAGESRQKILQQSQSGEILFDAAAGRLVSGDLAQATTSETPYRDLVIRVDVKGSLQLQLTKAEDDRAQ